MDEAGLLALGESLCREADRASPRAFIRLTGGKNNRVFRVELADGSSVVLKSYFHDPRDPRDRLHAEWSFLTYAWGRGVRSIPQPLASDVEAHAGLFSLLPGATPERADAEDVAAAADFICAVNAYPRDIARLPLGSEACLSLAQHLAMVDTRVTRLETIAADVPYREEAERLIRQRLQPIWAKVKLQIERPAVGQHLEIDGMAPGDLIASPSDFGFHNALQDDVGALRFIDFEYAGRDDPAKLAGDFFAVPAVPAPQEAFEAFIAKLARGLCLSAEFLQRARLLRDAYRVKWACIILNDFLPTEEARRIFSLGEERAERCRRQLDRAGVKLDEIAS